MCYLKHTVNHDDDDDVYYPRGKAKRIRIKTEITYSFDKKKILEGKPI